MPIRTAPFLKEIFSRATTPCNFQELARRDLSQSSSSLCDKEVAEGLVCLFFRRPSGRFNFLGGAFGCSSLSSKKEVAWEFVRFFTASPHASKRTRRPSVCLNGPICQFGRSFRPSSSAKKVFWDFRLVMRGVCLVCGVGIHRTNRLQDGVRMLSLIQGGDTSSTSRTGTDLGLNGINAVLSLHRYGNKIAAAGAS